MDSALEAKIRELIDRQEIWEVVLRYSRGIDRLDRELIRSCYHEDAIDDHHIYVGKADEFIDWAFDYHARFNRVHHHGLSNHICEIDGDEAHAETYYTFIGVNREPPHMLSMGRYIDHFQRRSGVWKYANRVCVIEHSFDLMPNPRDAPPANEQAGIGPPPRATRDRSDASYQRPVQVRQPLAKAR